MESELTKIALVHLYAQGFTGESLVNFEIKLTNPSIVYEQERVALMKEKIDLAAQMIDTKLFSTDYIYDNIFHLSEDKYNEMRELIREDFKRNFRLAQIEGEGNDPAQSGRSYGTPHDLASMYGRRSTATDRLSGGGQGSVPPGYEDHPAPPKGLTDPGEEGGRPRTNMSMYHTNDNPLGGRDPLGSHGMKGGYPSDNENVMEGFNTKAIYHRNKEVLKEMVFNTQKKDESNLLKEDNIRDLGE